MTGQHYIEELDLLTIMYHILILIFIFTLIMLMFKELLWGVFREYSPSLLRFIKNHNVGELVQDSINQGPPAWFDSAMLESLHAIEKEWWYFSNKHNNNAHFGNEVYKRDNHKKYIGK